MSFADLATYYENTYLIAPEYVDGHCQDGSKYWRRPAIIAPIMSDAASELVLRRQAKRYEFLRFVFVESGASEMTYVDNDKIKKELVLTHEEFTDISQYLRGEYLLGTATLPTTVLSHRGIVEMEASILNPQLSTEHFASVVIQTFNGPIYGGVQTGGQDNIQVVSIDQGEDDETQQRR